MPGRCSHRCRPCELLGTCMQGALVSAAQWTDRGTGMAAVYLTDDCQAGKNAISNREICT